MSYITVYIVEGYTYLFSDNGHIQMVLVKQERFSRSPYIAALVHGTGYVTDKLSVINQTEDYVIHLGSFSRLLRGFLIISLYTSLAALAKSLLISREVRKIISTIVAHCLHCWVVHLRKRLRHDDDR